MDAVFSFLRDVRNWLGFVLGCIAVVVGLAIWYLIGRAAERALPDDEPEPVAARAAVAPPPPPPALATPPTPTVALADWSAPSELDEARAFVSSLTSLPPDTTVELDGSGATFTVAEVESLVAVWERTRA